MTTAPGLTLVLPVATAGFEPDARALYVHFTVTRRREVARTLVNEGATVAVDLDENGYPVGVEILLDEKQAEVFSAKGLTLRPSDRP